MEKQTCWKHKNAGNNSIQTHLQMAGWREEQVDLSNAHSIIFYFKYLSKIIQILIILVLNIFDLVLQSVLRIESNDLKDEISLRWSYITFYGVVEVY